VHGIPPEGVGAGHTREGNREAKRRHVTRGTVHQVLVYAGDRCVGWCQFGSPLELPNIKNRRTYDRGAADPPDWRIGCVFTSAKDRGKGVAAAAVAAALGEIMRAGGGVVEAYPEQTEERPLQRGAYLHTGPEELYARYGFTRVRKMRNGCGSCAPGSDPAARRRSRKEMHCGCDRRTYGVPRRPAVLAEVAEMAGTTARFLVVWTPSVASVSCALAVIPVSASRLAGFRPITGIDTPAHRQDRWDERPHQERQMRI